MNKDHTESYALDPTYNRFIRAPNSHKILRALAHNPSVHEKYGSVDNYNTIKSAT